MFGRVRRMRKTLLLLASLAVLPLLGCGTSIGDTCDSSGCGSDLSCRADLPGGFCTKSCTQAGDTASCTEDSVCVQQFSALMCAPRCEEQSDCREGYQCNGLTGSSIKACQVKL
jgi:hypothetical protein